MINDRLHDKLQQLAHGELDTREETALRAEIARNPEAQALLAEYSQLKVDMNLLQEIPPDQLSKERLRARLLGEALKPEKAAPVWTWLWMPTMAAALAFVVYFNRTKPIEMPPIVNPGDSVTAKHAPGSEALAKTFAQPSASSEKVFASKVKPAPVTSVAPDSSSATTEASPSLARTVSVRRESSAARSAKKRGRGTALPTEVSSEPSGAVSALFAMGKVASDAVAVMAPAAAPTISDKMDNTHSGDSLVVISNSVDADTGAQHATEEVATNVLVGG